MSVKTPYFLPARATGVPALLREAGSAPASSPWTARSEREAQVARALTAGDSNREVVARLFISERTVKAHLGAAFAKLGARVRLQRVLRLGAWTAPLPSPATALLA